MALSYINYPADGSTTQFDITFGYLRRTHVFVFVDNSLVGFKWISSTRIEISPAPPLEAEVRIQRLTDKVNRITSTLRPSRTSTARRRCWTGSPMASCRATWS